MGSIVASDRDERTRRACMDWATALNDLRECPKEDMSEVIEDAAAAEFYITNGQSVAVYCADRLSSTIRG